MNTEARNAIDRMMRELLGMAEAEEEKVIAKAKAEGEEPDNWSVRRAGEEQRAAIRQIRQAVAVYEFNAQLSKLFASVQ